MIKALAITGPTASGKTALSIELAKLINAEIISCDSMQIYKGMDIGTAKATKAEQGEVPHHLINIISSTESFSAENYRAAAMAAARDIVRRGKVPLFVGGTGLYIDTVIRGITNGSPESDPKYRNSLLLGIKSESDKISLWERLNEVDPESAEKIHYNNVKRVIRALEIYDKTGIPKTRFDKNTKSASTDIKVGMMTLDFHDREILYSRVNRRVDIMMEEGLLEEVTALYNAGMLPDNSTASQAIGYKEIISYIRGECTVNDAIERIKLSSRRYAKRQLTWFRHESEAIRIYVDSDAGGMRNLCDILSDAVTYAENFLKN